MEWVIEPELEPSDLQDKVDPARGAELWVNLARVRQHTHTLHIAIIHLL